MKEGFQIEGHRAKTGYQTEDTLILNDPTVYPSAEAATTKAREHLGQDQDLGLVLIYAVNALEERTVIRFLFREQSGDVEEVDSWWEDGGIPDDCCSDF